MRMLAYPQYKSSGQVWLGDVPAHWDIQRIKHSLREKKSINGANLACGAISFGKVISKDSDSIPEETRQTYQEVLAGEYLINPINLNYDLKSLRTALSDINVCVSPAYIVVRSDKSKVFPKYGEYLLHLFDIAHMKTLGAGVRQTITFNDIGNCSWCLPPLIEQEQIAIFLDRETIRIDTLIEKKTRFIELLKEKRQAVITKAVTKGIDPSVRMKDSGINWIGQIPIHWQTKRLKHNLKLITEKADTRTFAIALEHIEGWSGRLLPNESEFDGDGVLFKGGDILFGKLRPYLAKVYLSEASGEAVGDIWVLRPTNGNHPKFLQYQLLNREFITTVNASTTGAKMPRANWDFVGSLTAPTPPYTEQVCIADFLLRVTSRIDQLIEKTRASVELLNEHRAALITAAVTGKIDVRMSK